jgi:hypothetical protein
LVTLHLNTHRVVDERDFLFQARSYELEFPFEVFKSHDRVVVFFHVGFKTRLIHPGDFGIEQGLKCRKAVLQFDK